MKWGTILVPNTSDALSAIMMYSLFRGLSHLGGAEAAGVKPLLSVNEFLSISYENRSIHIRCGDYYHPLRLVR